MKSSYSVCFVTLGCKLNQIETESAANYFSQSGFSILMSMKTKSNSPVLLCIVNTCTVTSKAEQKARRIINHLLEVFPQATILVTGCYAEVESDYINSIDPRIVVLKGTKKDYLSVIPVLLEEWLNKSEKDNSLELNPIIIANYLKTKILTFTLKQTNFTLSTTSFYIHSRASIKVQDGCNNNCAYCRIHIARGPSVSLEAEKVLDRVKKLEQNGYSEVILTGVNLSQYYSYINTKKSDFVDLLSFLLENTKKIGFRISSLYPDRVDEKLCKIIINDRVKPHFHLSVQSGSDNILTRMNRTYTKETIIMAAKRLRQVKKNCFLACDVITGFPGETEEDFFQTIEMCKQCNFTWIHAFPFSPRPGTIAFDMKPKIPQSIAGTRVQQLTELASSNKSDYIRQFIGKKLFAVVEKRRLPDIRVVTDNFLHVKISGFEGNLELPIEKLGGSRVVIRINKAYSGVSQTEECEAEGVILEFY